MLVFLLAATTAYGFFGFEDFFDGGGDTVGNDWDERENNGIVNRTAGALHIESTISTVHARAIHNFTVTTPTNITYSIRRQSTGGAGSAFISFWSGGVQGLECVFGGGVSGSEIRCYNGSTLKNVGELPAATYLQVDFRAINYTQHTYNLYLDGVLNQTNMSFRNDIDQIDQVNLTISWDGASRWFEVDYFWEGNDTAPLITGINTVNISPNSPVTTSELIGKASGTYRNISFNTSYEFQWYQNGTLYQTGESGVLYTNFTNEDEISTNVSGNITYFNFTLHGPWTKAKILRKNVVITTTEINITLPLDCFNNSHIVIRENITTEGKLGCYNHSNNAFKDLFIGLANETDTFDGLYRGVEINQSTVETQIAIIPSNNTFIGDNWTLFARAYANFTLTEWLQTSVNISSISVDTCGTNTYVLINFTIYEENNRTALTADVQGNVNVSVDSQEFSKELFDLNDVQTFSVCVSPPNVTYFVSAYIQYEAEGLIKERYYIDNATINSTRNVFMFNFRDQLELSRLKAEVDNFIFRPQQNIIMKLLRLYPQNDSYVAVQIDKSDELGNGVFYVYQNDVDYRFLFEKDGVVLHTTEPFKLICDASDECEQIFVIPSVSAAQRFESMTFVPSYNNNTGIVSITWSDSSNTVESVRLLVENQRPQGPVTICDSNVSSSSGTIFCNISGVNGLISVRAYRTASPEDPFYIEIIEVVVNAFTQLAHNTGINLERTGAFFGFFIMAFSSMLGFYGAIPAIIFTIFGMLLMLLFKIWSTIGFTFLIGGAALGTIIAFTISRRRP